MTTPVLASASTPAHVVELWQDRRFCPGRVWRFRSGRRRPLWLRGMLDDRSHGLAQQAVGGGEVGRDCTLSSGDGKNQQHHGVYELQVVLGDSFLQPGCCSRRRGGNDLRLGRLPGHIGAQRFRESGQLSCWRGGEKRYRTREPVNEPIRDTAPALASVLRTRKRHPRPSCLTRSGIPDGHPLLVPTAHAEGAASVNGTDSENDLPRRLDFAAQERFAAGIAFRDQRRILSAWHRPSQPRESSEHGGLLKARLSLGPDAYEFLEELRWDGTPICRIARRPASISWRLPTGRVGRHVRVRPASDACGSARRAAVSSRSSPASSCTVRRSRSAPGSSSSSRCAPAKTACRPARSSASTACVLAPRGSCSTAFARQ
jgi:hypothetical protein